MKRVVGWIRKGRTSAEAKQEEAIRAYCLKNDMEIVEWRKGSDFTDTAYGNWIGHRRIDAVVVADNMSVSGSVLDYYAFQCKLRLRGSDLCVAEWSDYPGYVLHQKVLEGLVDVLVRKEFENDPVRSANGRVRKTLKGGYIGGKAPMGYKVEAGMLVVNPEEVPVVEFIMDEKHRGGTKLGTVEKLNDGGYKTRNGGPFKISTVQSIWNNEQLYRGYRKSGDEWVPGQHEAIIKN